ncbi:MAG: phosphatidate cytidylyltransferase [Desulfatitalea sp.]|nr:phosphatidate cytidylyltransferase [Desulfatitalea sp.]NNK02315.1 phosphatidate cytidylyltransferase [Desulfatitalea sp.]
MHAKRWLTAVIILPLLLTLILKGGLLLFTFLIASVSVVAQWEYYRIVFSDHIPKVNWYYPFWGYLFGVGIPVSAGFGHSDTAAILLAISAIGAATLSIFRFKTSTDAPMVVLKQVFGVIYIPLLLSFAVLLYRSNSGIHWVLLLLLVVSGGDTGAFYAGTYFGRNKLCPAVSPKKTVEGSIGGLAAGVLLSLGYALLLFDRISLSYALAFALVVGVSGQAGDLFESEFKRVADVKDSGNLLPGHGGFLDRIDAILFAAPTAYIFKECLPI